MTETVAQEARRLGISTQAVYQRRRKAQGTCTGCGAKPMKGRIRCQACLNKNKTAKKGIPVETI